MHQSVLVSVLQSQGHLTGNLAGVGDAQRTSRRQPIDTRAIDQFHHEKQRAIFFTGIEGRDNVRMVQPANQVHFLLESLQKQAAFLEAGPQYFQGHQLAEPQMSRAIHGAHAAAADDIEQFIVAEARETIREVAKDVLDDGRVLR